MFDLARLERELTRRSRLLRGVRSAGVGFAAAAALILVAALASRLGAMPLRLGPSVAAFLIAAATTTVGFVAGYAPRPDVARLLLSVDLALATGERLCSLHELRSRSGASTLEDRIATDAGSGLSITHPIR